MRVLLPILITISLCIMIILPYLFFQRKKSSIVEKKISQARADGLNEPLSLHPRIDPDRCIGSGACIKACPENDILGVAKGKGCLVLAARCVGHGACAAACPVGAISLVFGTETRGVDIPNLTPRFETNVAGIFIAGELGGMGLIKNAMLQGQQAIGYIVEDLRREKKDPSVYDVIIVGAGPAGISGGLRARELGLDFLMLNEETLGGAILQYPRKKIVMTSPVNIPLFGSFRKRTLPKEELLALWEKVASENSLPLHDKEPVTGIVRENGNFIVKTTVAEYRSRKVLLAIGRRGSPRKLGVTGEELPKVAYRLLDPDQHQEEDILLVGGGDSAVEAALALSDKGENRVSLSCRKAAFNRLKSENMERLQAALCAGLLKIYTNSNVTEISERSVTLKTDNESVSINNDFVYVFIGGDIPTAFLNRAGIKIEKKFGSAL